MRRTAGVLAAVMLSGCMVGPDYRQPDAPMSVGYKELSGWQQAVPQADIDRGAWWSVYRDSTLDALERQIDVSNQTLKQAEASYRYARAIVDEARSNLFPTLSLTPQVTRSGSGASSSGRAATEFSLEGSAGWDVDVWGRIRRLVESDVAAAQASAADVASARLSAQGQLATYYFDLRSEDSLQVLLDRTVADYQRSLQITQNQYGAGIVAQSDVLTAQALLQSTQAQQVAVAVLRHQYEHAIAVLTGHPPAEVAIPPAPLASYVPIVPAGVPSTLLQRRPDISAAERAMEQENALIGVTVAAYYPDITLSALYGYAGNPLGSLLSAANRVWSLGAAGSEVLFEGGYRTAAVRAARAGYDQSVASYRETVLTSFQQVEDQLSNLRVLAQQARVENAAVQSVRRAVQATLNEYRAGTVPFTTVITEETQQLADEQTALSIQASRLIASVALIQALGGGWDTSRLPSKNSLQTNNPLLP